MLINENICPQSQDKLQGQSGLGPLVIGNYTRKLRALLITTPITALIVTAVPSIFNNMILPRC